MLPSVGDSHFQSKETRITKSIWFYFSICWTTWKALASHWTMAIDQFVMWRRRKRCSSNIFSFGPSTLTHTHSFVGKKIYSFFFSFSINNDPTASTVHLSHRHRTQHFAHCRKKICFDERKKKYANAMRWPINMLPSLSDDCAGTLLLWSRTKRFISWSHACHWANESHKRHFAFTHMEIYSLCHRSISRDHLALSASLFAFVNLIIFAFVVFFFFLVSTIVAWRENWRQVVSSKGDVPFDLVNFRLTGCVWSVFFFFLFAFLVD